jgi:hypothetical protein
VARGPVDFVRHVASSLQTACTNAASSAHDRVARTGAFADSRSGNANLSIEKNARRNAGHVGGDNSG